MGQESRSREAISLMNHVEKAEARQNSTISASSYLLTGISKIRVRSLHGKTLPNVLPPLSDLPLGISQNWTVSCSWLEEKTLNTFFCCIDHQARRSSWPVSDRHLLRPGQDSKQTERRRRRREYHCNREPVPVSGNFLLKIFKDAWKWL